MRDATLENERVIKEIEFRRLFYDKILNGGKEAFELADNDVLKFSREQLYNEIWELSVSKVATKYNVSYAKLKQACVDADIPTPSNSYWGNLSIGNPVTKTPLPISAIKEVVIHKTKSLACKYDEDNTFEGNLLFLENNERKIIFDSLKELTINNSDKLHPKIVQHDKKIKLWKQSHPIEPKASHKRSTYYTPPTDEPFLFWDVSESSLPRIYRMLNSLFKCIEALGDKVNEDLSLTVRNEIVRYKVTEGEDKVPHVLTRDEEKAMEKYERDRISGQYAFKPNIRKWDYIFNGKLKISVVKNKNYRDDTNSLIEQRLSEIFIDIYEESENVRIAREAREEAARKAEEEKKRRERQRELYNSEEEKVVALENEAEDFAIACKIRAYVAAVESRTELTEDTKEWIKWARDKADWYDPTIAKNDELLGKRKHGEDKDQKTPKKKYSYYW